MDSDFQPKQYQHHFEDQEKQFPHQKQQNNGGLTRYRSAPSTYFASFLDAVDTTVSSCNNVVSGEKTDFSTARPLSPETENIFASFMSNMGEQQTQPSSQKLCNIPENSMLQQQQPQYMAGVKQESTETLQQQSHFSPSSSQHHMIYQSQSKPPLGRHNNSSSTLETSYLAPSSSMGIDSLRSQMNDHNNNNGSSSGLTRHSSSPAGFFANILIDNVSSGLMSQNSDVGAKTTFNNPAGNNNRNNNNNNYMAEYHMNSSWDDSILTDNLSSLDRVSGDDDMKTFSELNASENQGGDGRNRPPPLAHQLSLPNTSAELSAMEKILHFQDSVPCKIRAKRGFATHPRSIAERVRRTRISERMRKLQDLVPNMDKQTNTADMLDLAVEYIKDLQKEVKTLNDNRANCTCST